MLAPGIVEKRLGPNLHHGATAIDSMHFLHFVRKDADQTENSGRQDNKVIQTSGGMHQAFK